MYFDDNNQRNNDNNDYDCDGERRVREKKLTRRLDLRYIYVGHDETVACDVVADAKARIVGHRIAVKRPCDLRQRTAAGDALERNVGRAAAAGNVSIVARLENRFVERFQETRRIFYI